MPPSFLLWRISLLANCLYFLSIQDYFDIIKKPMDLSTIKRKLDTGQYNNPWEVHVLQLFELFSENRIYSFLFPPIWLAANRKSQHALV